MSAHVGEQLAAYLDGELSPRDGAEVETHLAGCAACARKLEDLSSVDAAVRALPAEPPSGYFDRFPGRVRARLQPRPRRAISRLPVWYAAAAAAVLVAAIAPAVLKRSGRVSAPASQDAAPAAPRPATARTQEAGSPEPPLTPAPPAKEGTLRVYRDTTPREQGLAKRRLAPAPPPRGILGARPEPPPLEEPALDEALSGFAELPAASAPTAPSAADEPRTAEAQAGGASIAGRSAAAKSEEGDERRREKKALETAAARAPAEAEAFALTGEETSYRELLGRVAGTLDEARALRESWRAYLRRYPEGARTDEAHARLADAGYAAYQLSRDPEDRAHFREDAAAYLQRRNAREAERMRLLLRSLEP